MNPRYNLGPEGILHFLFMQFIQNGITLNEKIRISPATYRQPGT